MPHLVKRQTTAQDVNGDTHNHNPGDVVSDWELSEHIRKMIGEGSVWYTQTYEPLTDQQAHSYRVKATAAEGARTGANGAGVEPPWDDYVGLHPKEVTERMTDEGRDKVTQVREYERAGLNRAPIMEFVAPSEREPYAGYDSEGTREILEKMSLLDDKSVQDIIAYEMDHQKRPAVISYERETYESQAETQTTPAGVA